MSAETLTGRSRRAVTAAGVRPRPPRTVRTGALYLCLVLLAIVMATPFVAMALLSLRPATAISLREIFFSTTFTIEHFRTMFENASLVRWILNSFIYAGVSVVLVLLLSSLAGYAFAKKHFFGKNAIFWTFIAMLVVPSQLTIVPLFILVVKMEGVNTYWGLILPTLASAQGVFLMRQYILGLPDELLEAAKIDGASEFRIYWQIVLPLCTPVLATLGIFVFLWHWNDFLWPLIVTQSDEMRLLTVGLATLQDMVPSTHSMMAAAAISFFPSIVIFVVFQRFIVQSIATSGIKG
ncbi:MAG: carbohydrate ABC transporter permease [Thermomicrobiales bacterium]